MADSLPHSSPPPLDLSVLRRQSGGDAALEREVLGLFLVKAERDVAAIAAATSADQRRAAAHGLVGSARAVGADEVARLAAALAGGRDPTLEAVAALRAAVAAAGAFVRTHLRATGGL